MNVILATDRLVLRQMSVSDAIHLLEIFSDPAAMKYYPSTKNRSETLQWIEWNQLNYQRYDAGLWIIEKKSSGAFIGQCGIVPQSIEGKTEFEIGYLFKRSYWGKGFASEAAMGCKYYGFNELLLPKLISLIDIKNNRSVKVAERIGMRLEKNVVKWEKMNHLYSVYNRDRG
ncbi:GNAT family N-acetyltransferase [Halobacillus salinarum]|uniref:GNAT family N-acetyltransferase n=1 Tax=Halobacillus salinarum TaxID=2932257 RepID=A0ABY4EHE8_9BACI|nr:GNAT family N-acetyltransferase [Halobacillus salinarum]UOQ43885.1 GNAT family N-acetyltransferase [Halobacillus salinarum]